MSSVCWHGSVVDAPDTDPYTVLGDLLLAVRTPRSQDFVTVEVARAPGALNELPGGDLLISSRPPPLPGQEWDGEVRLHDSVDFDVEGVHYRLTLDRLSDSPAGPPWVICEFSLERD